MGYYMRYIVVDEGDLTITALENILKQVDPAYSISDVSVLPRGESGVLTHGQDVYGEIEINKSGSDLLEEEQEELEEFLEDSTGKQKDTVLHTPENAQATVAIRVLWQDRQVEDTLSRIDPLWEWLFENHKGLLQVDGEGYYDSSGLILEE